MNAIETLLKVLQICEAYGAEMVFVRRDAPVTCILPTSNGEVIRCFTEELLNLLGIYTEVDGNKITFTL